jgi:AraC-like DNA-binding protein
MISVLQVAPIVTTLVELGLDAPRLLALAGLRQADLASPSSRVSAASELLLWEAAVKLSGDPAIGLRVAERIAPGALGSFEYLLRHSETLHALLERAQRYGRLVDDISDVSVRCADGVATIRVGRIGNYPVPAAGAECLFAVVLAIARANWPEHGVLGVRFSHAAHAESARYRARLGCSVQFACEANEILCPEAALHVRARNADPALGRVLEDHTTELLSRLPSTQTFTETAREKLRQLGAFDPEPVARALGISERTMRRRLASEGMTFQLLVDELRKSIALARVLANTSSLDALASDLGFADTSTLYRAFRRWTGTTPVQYRARSRRVDC